MNSHQNRIKASFILFAAMCLTILYYVYGAQRARSYIFRISGAGWVTPEPLECQFIFFFTVVAIYFVFLLTLFFIFYRERLSVRQLAFKLLCHKYSPLILALLSFGGMILVRFALLEQTPLTDDENAYLFTARTLLEGRLINPGPEFPELFRNQFVHADQNLWFSQYLIGHPLFLALGITLGMVDFIVPLCGLATIGVCYLISKRVYGQRTAQIAVALIALSPHFILTSGTLLGYTTAALASSLLIYGALRLEESIELKWLGLFTISSLLLILNRPFSWLCLGLPLAILFIYLAIRDRSRRRVYTVVLMGFAAIISVSVFLLINYLQTGDPFVTTKELYYATKGYGYGFGFGASSILGEHTLSKGLANFLLSAARQNIWLFGWPISLFFIVITPFLDKRFFSGFLLLWLFIFYVFQVYVFSPGVMTTGPNHYLEMVVPGALLSARGITLADRFVRENLRLGAKTELIPSMVVSLILCCALLFTPPVLGAIGNCAREASRVYRLLDQVNAHNAIVFINKIVPTSYNTFVYFPPNSGPDLQAEDRIYVRWPDSREKLEAFVAKFPEREVWGVFFDSRGQAIVARKGSEIFDEWKRFTEP
jgi:hypothetical protein